MEQNYDNENYGYRHQQPDYRPGPGNRYNDDNRRPNTPPETYLWQSILVTLFCCLPFGIVGIVNAAKVESAFYQGNYDEADRLSREAKKWTLVSFWVGLAGIVLYFLFIFVMMMTGQIEGFSDIYGSY